MWIAIVGFIVVLFIWGCWFVNKKDPETGLEGGSKDDLYTRFIDDELSS